MPEIRAIVQKSREDLTFSEVDILLESPYHEECFAGVITLVFFSEKKRYPLPEIAQFYMDHAKYINNWDLVDASSGFIIGPYLTTLSSEEREKYIDACVSDPSLWVNRIIILASFYPIKNGDGAMIFALAPRFFSHPHDLIHKAVGWMLREAGKRQPEKLRDFLDQYASRMPRTMLRYAIEKFDPEERKKYMKQKTEKDTGESLGNR